jgi:hypothetical protein
LLQEAAQKLHAHPHQHHQVLLLLLLLHAEPGKLRHEKLRWYGVVA